MNINGDEMEQTMDRLHKNNLKLLDTLQECERRREVTAEHDSIARTMLNQNNCQLRQIIAELRGEV